MANDKFEIIDNALMEKIYNREELNVDELELLKAYENSMPQGQNSATLMAIEEYWNDRNEGIYNEMSDELYRDVVLAEPEFELDIPHLSVIKNDLYATQLLKALSELKNLVGGSCLSKCYRVIGRVTDGIDFKIAPTAEGVAKGKNISERNNFLEQIKSVIADKTDLTPQVDQYKPTVDNNIVTTLQCSIPRYENGSSNSITIKFFDLPSLHPTQMMPISSLLYGVRVGSKKKNRMRLFAGNRQ